MFLHVSVAAVKPAADATCKRNKLVNKTVVVTEHCVAHIVVDKVQRGSEQLRT